MALSGRVSGLSRLPLLPAKVPKLFLLASSRRGGLAGAVSTHPRTLQRRLRREQEEERVEYSAEEEEASDDDVGPLLGQLLGME